MLHVSNTVEITLLVAVVMQLRIEAHSLTAEV